MTVTRALTLLFLSLCCQAAGLAVAQPVSELPRAEYYVARELYRAGRTLEASDGFRTAINRARRIGEQRWIDSIPPLVMLGECFYQQGNMAQALEQYDKALMLAIANPGWIDQLQIQVEQLTELEPTAKGINWFAKSRPSRAVVVPAGIQLSVDPTQAQGTALGGVIAPVSLVTQLDVTEILRTLGIALLRRWEALGPLANHLPQSEPLEALFAHPPSQAAPWVLSSWKILQGLSGLASPAGGDARQLLREGILIGNQSDYFFSPLALVALGKLEARDGNHQAAIVSLQDAALLAAQFEQHAITSEALQALSASAAAAQRVDLVEPLQRATAWANKRSVSIQVAGLTGAAELAIMAKDHGLAEKCLKQCTALLRGREIALTRQQAQVAYVNALLAFAQNRGPQGISSLDNALKMIRGSSTTGVGIQSVFQAQMALDFLASQSLTSADAETVLMEALAEPNLNDWELQPLETLAELTTARSPAYVRLLELAADRNAPEEELLARLDQVQRQRIYEALPLGGRLFSIRDGLARDPADLQPEGRQSVTALLQRAPDLGTAQAQIDKLIAQLRQAPLPMDERKLAADTRRTFAELEERSAKFESQLAFQSLQRQAFVRLAPPTFHLAATQQMLSDTDLLLGLVVGSQQIHGVAITKDKTQFWTVNDVAQIEVSLKSLLSAIGVGRMGKPNLPSEAVGPKAAWRKSAETLSTQLFPADIQNLIDGCQRVIIAPHDQLWYVPYELLPQTGSAAMAPWIAHHAVTYVPTLGCVASAFGSEPTVGDSVGVASDFFAKDPDANQEQIQRLLQAVPNSQLISLSQKVAIPSATWLKLRTDQLWVANTTDSTGGWETPVLPFGKQQQAQLGSWLETPRTSPARVLLPGLQTAMGVGQLGNGNDLLLPVCSLMFSGTKTAVLSRWAVGGYSTSTILQRQLEELQFERPSSALRRAVLAQWPEQFPISTEPALLPAGKESATLITGFHPLLWSGYMSVGDYEINRQ